MKLLYFILACTPSFLHVNVRRLLGAKIARGARLRFGTLLLCSDVSLSSGASVGPFVFIKAKKFELQKDAKIKSFVFVSCPVVSIGEGSLISIINFVNCEWTPESKFVVGDHCSIFPYCWLEPGAGITMGNQVGVGGHGLIFTHGVWPSHLEGGPVARGPVTLKDGVWLPWRVFILPGVTIGESSIVGAGAVVNKSIPDKCLAAGMPAKVIKEGLNAELADEERVERLRKIFKDYAAVHDKKFEEGDNNHAFVVNGGGGRILFPNDQSVSAGDCVCAFNGEHISQEEAQSVVSQGASLVVFDHSTWYEGRGRVGKEFVHFLRRYGIRLYRRSVDQFSL